MPTIRKAVIPAAGFGTRMLPAAKAVPKEMLTVVDRPVIQYVVEEAAAGGVDDVLLVTSAHKRAIEDHFDENAELRAALKASGRENLLAPLDELAAKVKIHSVRQPRQRGLGDAVLQARHHVADQPFLCLLGDTIFAGDILPAVQLAQAHAKLGTAIIGLAQVPPERVARYGIVAGEPVGEGIVRITSLVEKPAPSEAPSRLAVAARYVLTPGVFECLMHTQPGVGGEIQLTDALRALLAREPIHGVLLSARRLDIGDPVGWLTANILMARRKVSGWKHLEASIDDRL